MSRKTIAVCVTGYDMECESRIIAGIWKHCLEADINVLVFSTLLKRLPLNLDFTYPDNVIRGELEIFNLINYDIIDGIILFGETMLNGEIIDRISERAKEKNIPLVNVNDPAHILEYNVSLDDSTAMEFIMRHLVEDHKLTKINFIGGFPGNPQTEERLDAYRKILAEHNIPVEENRIYYGEFWRKARGCTEEMINSGDIPEAIVCASDTMAFFCMDCLKEHGFLIPEEIIVTGFDGIKECEAYSPTLTTVRRGFDSAGVRAVEVLEEIWNGKNPPRMNEVNADLVLMQSCGCGMMIEKSSYNFYGDIYGAKDVANEFSFHTLIMNTKFAAVKDQLTLFSEARTGAEFFKLESLNICICSNIIQDSEELNKDELLSEYSGISDTMINMFSYGNSVPVGTSFPSSKLSPEEILDREKPVLYSFSPLYFRDSFLGYMSYEPSKIKGYGEHFATWLMYISSNAGSFYMNKKLEQVVEQLDNLYVRDPLTGLFNRRGMSKFGSALVDKARKTNMLVTVICTDIDNLKPINDLYGHEAGDNAILRTAEAIGRAAPKDSVCTRTGGDEFCSILLGCDAEKTTEIIKHIEELLDDYNRVSGLEYNIGCSCGFYCMEGSKVETIEKIAAFADEEMYKEKVRKKAIRKM